MKSRLEKMVVQSAMKKTGPKNHPHAFNSLQSIQKSLKVVKLTGPTGIKFLRNRQNLFREVKILLV
jgi:hypothetical protein